MSWDMRASRPARSLRFLCPFLVREIAPLSRIRSYRTRVDMRSAMIRLRVWFVRQFETYQDRAPPQSREGEDAQSPPPWKGVGFVIHPAVLRSRFRPSR